MTEKAPARIQKGCPTISLPLPTLTAAHRGIQLPKDWVCRITGGIYTPKQILYCHEKRPPGNERRRHPSVWERPAAIFPAARIRFIRYDGTEAKVGAEMNVVKDKIFTGRILDMVEKTLSFVRDQIKEHTYLGKEGKFVTTPEFP